MVHSDGSSSKGDAFQVRGRTEQRSSCQSYNCFKSQENRSRSKSRPQKKFCKYCKKKNHFIEDYLKLQAKKNRKNNSDGKASVTSGVILKSVAGGIETDVQRCLEEVDKELRETKEGVCFM